MKKNIILLNPSSGRNRAIKNKDRLEKLLAENKIDYELFVSKSEQDLRGLIQENFPHAKSLIAAGGDSTFTILINEMSMVQKKIPVGIIPLGSSDDIALEYNIKNLTDAVKAIKEGKTKKTDVGVIKAPGSFLYYFPGQANVGIGASVNKFVASNQGNQILSGIQGMYEAFKNKRVPQDFTIEFDRQKIQGNFISLLFSKIKYWAGGRLFLPGATIDDGKIHLLSIEGRNGRPFKEFVEILKIMLKSKKGKHIDNKYVKVYKSEKFSISSSQEFIIQVDGDIIQESPGKSKDKKFKKIEVGILKKQIDVIYNTWISKY